VMRYQAAGGESVYHRTMGHGTVTERGPVFSTVKFDNGTTQRVSNIMLSSTPSVVSTLGLPTATVYDYPTVRGILKLAPSKRRPPSTGGGRAPRASLEGRIEQLKGEITLAKQLADSADRDIAGGMRSYTPGERLPIEVLAARGRKIWANAEIRAKQLQVDALERAQARRLPGEFVRDVVGMTRGERAAAAAARRAAGGPE